MCLYYHLVFYYYFEEIFDKYLKKISKNTLFFKVKTQELEKFQGGALLLSIFVVTEVLLSSAYFSTSDAASNSSWRADIAARTPQPDTFFGSLSMPLSEVSELRLDPLGSSFNLSDSTASLRFRSKIFF